MTNAHLKDKRFSHRTDIETLGETDVDCYVTRKKDVGIIDHEDKDRHTHPLANPRLTRRTPSLHKSLALILSALFLFGIAFTMRARRLKENHEVKVIYASRYSKEHQFRPAASPVITEILKDGTVLIRGAAPAATARKTG